MGRRGISHPRKAMEGKISEISGRNFTILCYRGERRRGLIIIKQVEEVR
jgi:hypothetical protein